MTRKQHVANISKEYHNILKWLVSTGKRNDGKLTRTTSATEIDGSSHHGTVDWGVITAVMIGQTIECVDRVIILAKITTCMWSAPGLCSTT